MIYLCKPHDFSPAHGALLLEGYGPTDGMDDDADAVSETVFRRSGHAVVSAIRVSDCGRFVMSQLASSDICKAGSPLVTHKTVFIGAKREFGEGEVL